MSVQQSTNEAVHSIHMQEENLLHRYATHVHTSLQSSTSLRLQVKNQSVPVPCFVAVVFLIL